MTPQFSKSVKYDGIKRCNRENPYCTKYLQIITCHFLNDNPLSILKYLQNKVPIHPLTETLQQLQTFGKLTLAELQKDFTISLITTVQTALTHQIHKEMPRSSWGSVKRSLKLVNNLQNLAEHFMQVFLPQRSKPNKQ